MEYVLVSYPTDRRVRIDEQFAGRTNETLMVEKGHHDFDLGVPANYAPSTVRRNVRGTTAVTPLEIADFKPKRASRPSPRGGGA